MCPKLEASLLKSAKSIGKHLGLRRVLVFGYNVAKLLRKGHPKFRNLSKKLLASVRSILGEPQDGSAVAIVTHNSAAWIVQDAIVQWQYDRNLGNAPVGVLTFGLPKSLLEDSWHKDDWSSYRRDLIKHVLKKAISPYKEDSMLDFDTINQASTEFKKLVAHLDRFSCRPEIREVGCPDRKVIIPQPSR